LGAAWRWTVYWEVGIYSVNNDFVVSLIQISVQETLCESLHHTNLKCGLDDDRLGLSHITILRRNFIAVFYLCLCKNSCEEPRKF